MGDQEQKPNEVKPEEAAAAAPAAAEMSEAESAMTGQPAKFASLQEDEKKGKGSNNLELILDVSAKVTVELGRTEMFIKDVLSLNIGSVIEIDKLAGEPVDVLINDKLIARGEVVVINENFGVRLTEIIGAEQRIKKLGAEG
jgi:flagellar motor switch protein FliN